MEICHGFLWEYIFLRGSLPLEASCRAKLTEIYEPRMVAIRVGMQQDPHAMPQGAKQCENVSHCNRTAPA